MADEDIRQEGIPSGLSAFILPELGNKDNHGNLVPLKPEELLKRVNAYLSMFDGFEMDVKGIVPVKVNMGRKIETPEDIIEERYLFIIKK